uniref:Uncharacterized protein n=1 Tax=Schistosoma haematobium TaxID=6185 RepID=A0A095A2R0_SCHHA
MGDGGDNFKTNREKHEHFRKKKRNKEKKVSGRTFEFFHQLLIEFPMNLFAELLFQCNELLLCSECLIQSICN